jgi:nucleoside 2-deoxyribosyltransferase
MFWYLATPYTNHPDGHEAAFLEACETAALLIRSGVPVFSPITHSHSIAACLPGYQTHDFWMNVDKPFMRTAFGAIVVRMKGWRESRGVAYEIEFFQSRGKPVFYIEPGELPCLATLRAYQHDDHEPQGSFW